MKRSQALKRRTPLRAKRPMKRALPRRVTRPGVGSDPAYLEWVRTLPCLCANWDSEWATPLGPHCNGYPSHAHHAGPKRMDKTAVPLCSKHHQEWHDANGYFKGMNKAMRQGWAETAIAYTQLRFKNTLS